MAYRFKLDESVRKGFRRIACEQIDLALGELSVEAASARAIHESRKALKRLRALIRSCAPALGPKTARRHNAAIRNIGHLLSSRRDCDVAFETIANLEERFGAESEAALLPLRSHIAARITDAASPFDARARDAIRAMLIKERRQLGNIELKGHGVERLMEGIEASYRQGRNAFKAAYAKPSDAAFHDLRKAVQTHWRQMALMSRAWPEEFAVRVAAARELSQLLGDDHDIAVLKLTAGSLYDSDRARTLQLCSLRQSELRSAAFFRLKRLYAEKPTAFGPRIKALWKAGRKIRAAATFSAASSAVISVVSEAHPVAEIGSQPRLAAKTPAQAPSQRRA